MLCFLNQLNEYWFWCVIRKVYVTFWRSFQVQALENNIFMAECQLVLPQYVLYTESVK